MRYLKTVTIIIIKYSHIQQKNTSPNINAENDNLLIHTLYLLSNKCNILQIFIQLKMYFTHSTLKHNQKFFYSPNI